MSIVSFSFYSQWNTSRKLNERYIISFNIYLFYHHCIHILNFDIYIIYICIVLDLSSIGATGRHWQIIPCSAWTGAGLIEGIDWIVSDIAARIYMMD